MSKETKIEWADSTLNFWSGCTKVSAGCANCYAETLSNRKLTNAAGELNIGSWGKGAPRKRHQSAFNLALRLNNKPWVCECGHDGYFVHRNYSHTDDLGTPATARECEKCGSLNFHRRRVFSLSLGDWLDPEVPIEWLAEMLDTIRECDQLQWLLVTKRPELWNDRLNDAAIFADRQHNKPLIRFTQDWITTSYIPKHVMVLTSVEDQKAADERIPALLKIPTAQRGLSCEPLLGPVDIGAAVRKAGFDLGCNAGRKPHDGSLEWVIVGGESGPGARACATDWIRSIGFQCDAAGVPVFVKQIGRNPEWNDAEMEARFYERLSNPKGGNITEWPEDLRVREFPKVV